MKNNNMLALGHNENVYVFNAIGIESLIVLEKDLEAIIKEYTNKGVKIFFVSQKFNEKLSEIKKTYIEDAYPIFLTLSMAQDDEPIGVKELGKNVEKATGIKLF